MINDNQKLNKRKCKECNEVFQKVSPLQSICSRACEYKYKSKKVRKKVSVKKQAEVFNMAGEKLSESNVFKEIWLDKLPNERKSFVTGKVLSDPTDARAWYFSHILAKGKAKYPMFKYYKKNIQLKEFDEHHTWEYKQKDIINNPLWSHVFQLKEELIEEYAQHLKLFELNLVEYYKTD